MPKKSKEDKRQGTRSKREELEDAFAKFDTDESGSLTVKEFADILVRPARPGGMPNMSKSAALERAAEIVGNYDLNGDGKLNVDEFIEWWSAANALDVSNVGGKGTVIVEPTRGARVSFDELADNMGSVSALARRGLQAPLAAPEVEQVLLLIDPRSVLHLAYAGYAEWPKEVKDKTTIFLLVPSCSSSDEALVMAEVGIQNLGCIFDIFPQPTFAGYKKGKIDGRVRLVRLDDYMAFGDAIVLKMMEEGAHWYPTTEQEDMLLMLGGKRGEMGGKSMLEEVLLDVPEIDGALSPGWTHHVKELSTLYKEKIVQVLLEIIHPILQEGSGLSPLAKEERKSAIGWHATWPSCQRNVYLAFSQASAERHAEGVGRIIGKPIYYDGKTGNRVLPIKVIDEFHVEPDDPDAADKKVKINGEPKLKWLDGIYGAEQQPVMIVEAEDTKGVKYRIGDGAERPYHMFVNHYRRAKPLDVCSIVFVAEKYAHFQRNQWLVPAIHEALDCADMVVFATYDELPAVCSYLSNAKFGSENVAGVTASQLVPGPSCHLFTLSSAMGQPLADGEIIAPALTVGPPDQDPAEAHRIPPSKFNAGKSNSPYFLRDEDMEPMLDRLIPAARGKKAVTLIQPAKVISNILRGIVLPDKATWHGVFGDDYMGIDTDTELREANDNIKHILHLYNKLLTGPAE